MKLPDSHFNNSGHERYAEFILRHLKKELRQKAAEQGARIGQEPDIESGQREGGG